MQTSELERVIAVPGAASVDLRSLLDGPQARPGSWASARRPCSSPSAETRGAGSRCARSDAVRLPLAIVVGAPAADSPWAGRLGAGDEVHGGRRIVRLPGLTVHVARWWAPRGPARSTTSGWGCTTTLPC